MKITESKLRKIIRSVIREASSQGGGQGDQSEEDWEKSMPKLDRNVPDFTRYFPEPTYQKHNHGKPAKYTALAKQRYRVYGYTDDTELPGPEDRWERNPDYTRWEKDKADAQSDAAGGEDQPTGGGSSTGGRRGKKGKKRGKKKDDEE